MTPNDFRSRQWDRDINEHIASVVERYNLDFYITVTFARGQYGPLRRCHVSDAARMVRGYANKIKTILYGRGSRDSKSDFRFVSWFEDKDRFGKLVPLHAHMLMSFPQQGANRLKEETETYWTKVGHNSPHRFSPSIDIQLAYDLNPVASYNGKNTEDGFTIENMIFFGISNN